MSKEFTRATFEVVANQMTGLGYDANAVKKEIGYALQLINRNSYLAKADRNTMCAAILHAANTGLTLNPSMKRAALVPRYQNGRVECCFEPMFQGLIYLAIQEGAAKSFNVQIVHQNDKFLAQPHDDKRPVIHEFDNFTDRGEAQGLYCIATMLDGTKQAELMSMEDVRKIRDRSESYIAFSQKKVKSSPWVTDFLEMAKKTIVKRTCKRLPSGTSESRLNAAIELDNSHYTVIESPRQAPKDEIEALSEEVRALFRNLDHGTVKPYRDMLNEKSAAGELTETVLKNLINELKPLNQPQDA